MYKEHSRLPSSLLPPPADKQAGKRFLCKESIRMKNYIYSNN